MTKNNSSTQLKTRKILVTGGQGFIGSHLVHNLVAKGHKVTIFDRYYDDKKFTDYGWKGKVRFRLGDLKDRDAVLEAVGHNDITVNLGGLLGTAETVNNPIPPVEVNIIGAINVFHALKEHKRRGFQIAVGNYWMNNPYSITKSTAERLALMYNKEHRTDIRVLRGMNVFGERQHHRPVRKIFPNVVIPALLGKDIIIYGTGDQVMDLIYVKDFSEVLARVILYDNIPNDIIYEAGVGGGMTINKAVDLILKTTKSKSKVNRVPMRAGEDKHSVVEISEKGWDDLRKHLNFHPKDLTPMKEAVAQSVAWYKKHLKEFPWD